MAAALGGKGEGGAVQVGDGVEVRAHQRDWFKVMMFVMVVVVVVAVAQGGQGRGRRWPPSISLACLPMASPAVRLSYLLFPSFYEVIILPYSNLTFM